MTETGQAHSRWSAAALLAPTAAALFTGVTAWTLHHPPAPTGVAAVSTPLPVTPSATPLPSRTASGSAVQALQLSIKREAAQQALLQKSLRSLRAHPASASTHSSAPVAAAGTSVGTAAAPSGTAATQTGGGSGTPAYQAPAAQAPVAQAPAPVYTAPAPAPPPSLPRRRPWCSRLLLPLRRPYTPSRAPRALRNES